MLKTSLLFKITDINVNHLNIFQNLLLFLLFCMYVFVCVLNKLIDVWLRNRKSRILNEEFVILDRNMADLVVNKWQFCTRQLSVDFINKYWKILKIKIKFFSTFFKIDSWKVNKTAIVVRKTSEPKCTYLRNPNTIVLLFLFT